MDTPEPVDMDPEEAKAVLEEVIMVAAVATEAAATGVRREGMAEEAMGVLRAATVAEVTAAQREDTGELFEPRLPLCT